MSWSDFMYSDPFVPNDGRNGIRKGEEGLHKDHELNADSAKNAIFCRTCGYWIFSKEEEAQKAWPL